MSRARGAVGLALVLGFWWINWHPTQYGLLSRYGFFPLWLGYVLAVDAACEWRTGTSLFTRSRRRWLGLFVASAPAWWIFEGFNRFLGNWIYIGATFGSLERFVLAALSFSTVIPAVFTTAELACGLLPARSLASGPRIPASPRIAAGWIGLGLLLAFGVVAMPSYFFPATWLCVLLVLDPLNHVLGWPSLTGRLARGNWRTVAFLSIAALVCGFFWELWNVNTVPKWIYDVPLDAFGLAETPVSWRLFEMPALGYGGYIPFGLELYAVYQFLAGLAGRVDVAYLRFDLESEGRLTKH